MDKLHHHLEGAWNGAKGDVLSPQMEERRKIVREHDNRVKQNADRD